VNLQTLREIIRQYKVHYNDIYKEEIYKWRSVAVFKQHWDIDSSNFVQMLERSLSKTGNLLDSKQYFPLGMLLQFARLDPEKLRLAFRVLYDEEADLTFRIRHFKEETDAIMARNPVEGLTYQDHRAIMVYLTLRYPKRYYLYKMKMFESFANMVEYSYKPKRGDVQNIPEYLTMCELISPEILQDQELIQLQRSKLTLEDYPDNEAHLLTQNLIYSAVRHLKARIVPTTTTAVENRLTFVNENLNARVSTTNLKGRFTNHIENERKKKQIGDLGEELVLEFEIKKCRNFGLTQTPVHKSKTEGDGLGFDILSFDANGDEIYIEVKCTEGSKLTPFYITHNELEMSASKPNNYFLYRLFNYSRKSHAASCIKRRGSLLPLCVNPYSYKVILE
jgi:hypothetical protein